MAAYIVGRVKVNNAEAYAKYREGASAAVAAYDGKYIVRGGNNELLEGDDDGKDRIVVIEFPSYEKAQAWYNSSEYAKVIAIRHDNADSQMVVVEGV